ncbi:atrophin-1-like [Cynara cardunculus var. scolymus]|uniref:Phox/Bem1p n=1 Tax=Cynara cardunculus var. scolymus TaxID=59895 RepID=A0A103YL03_CYNCS|nr:atrophin-1-like [Cynara cardunculus var. scolymus]KVI11061.1 Phox/Bem1p [Cynara cardunculus var. scolymus]
MPIRGADVHSLPRNPVKFLCSHGGKILPRPADGHLKYVGGETRVICVPRDISITELMKKLSSMFDGEMILKYQLMPEDLDILVTVRSDEDLRHMIEECDRHELLGAPRLRAFLFSANPIVMENQMGPMDHQSLEQRYINSVNGIAVHPSPMYNTFRPFPINTSYTTFSISSACSSPRTPPETASTATNSTTATSSINHDFTTSHGKLGSLSRTHSSPSLCNLHCNSPSNHQITSPNWNQSQQQNPANHHHHHQQQPQPHHYHPQPNHSPKPPLDRHPHKSSGPEHVGKTRSTGVGDYYRTNRGGGGHMSYHRGSAYEDYYGNYRYDRNESPPGSPLVRSPNGVSPSPSVRSGRS